MANPPAAPAAKPDPIPVRKAPVEPSAEFRVTHDAQPWFSPDRKAPDQTFRAGPASPAATPPAEATPEEGGSRSFGTAVAIAVLLMLFAGYAAWTLVPRDTAAPASVATADTNVDASSGADGAADAANRDRAAATRSEGDATTTPAVVAEPAGAQAGAQTGECAARTAALTQTRAGVSTAEANAVVEFNLQAAVHELGCPGAEYAVERLRVDNAPTVAGAASTSPAQQAGARADAPAAPQATAARPENATTTLAPAAAAVAATSPAATPAAATPAAATPAAATAVASAPVTATPVPAASAATGENTTDAVGRRDAVVALASPSRGVEATPDTVREIPGDPLIATVQEMLNSLGYQAGTVDGIAGLQTRTAIVAFQSNHGMSPDGQPTAPLLDALRSAQTLSRNTRTPAAPAQASVVSQRAEPIAVAPPSDARTGPETLAAVAPTPLITPPPTPAPAPAAPAPQARPDPAAVARLTVEQRIVVERWCNARSDASDAAVFADCMARQAGQVVRIAPNYDSDRLSSAQRIAIEDQCVEGWPPEPRAYLGCVERLLAGSGAGAAAATRSANPAPSGPAPAPRVAVTAPRGVNPPTAGTEGISPEDDAALKALCERSAGSGQGSAFATCVRGQRAALAATHQPGLSFLSQFDRNAIRAGCADLRLREGPAAYYRCLAEQLSDLSRVRPKPDVTTLPQAQRNAIDLRCAPLQRGAGIAAYYACVNAEIGTPQARADR